MCWVCCQYCYVYMGSARLRPQYEVLFRFLLVLLRDV